MNRRMTIPRLTVLGALATAGTFRCGVELMAACDLPSGTIYPILDRLTTDELATRRRVPGTNRVYLELTPAGYEAAEQGRRWALAEMAVTEERRAALAGLLARLPAPELAPCG